jgi:type II secretory pathway pseudopilin PulG
MTVETHMSLPMHCRPAYWPSKRSFRHAFTILEVSAAGVMLATAMVIAVQVLALSSAQAREVERRQFAIQEAANLLERLTAAAWDTLNTDLAAAQQLPAESQSRLPGGELKVAIETIAGPPASKRIAVEIRWRNRSGEFTSPVRLTAWVYRPEAADE